MMRSYIIPVFLIIVSFYLFYRVYSVAVNISVINKNTEIEAMIVSKNATNYLYTYKYTYNNHKYSRTEKVDQKTYINHVVNEPVRIFIDPENPEKSVIKNNKVAISYISLGRNDAGHPINAPVWIGYLVSALVFLFGVYRIYKSLKNTSKTF